MIIRIIDTETTGLPPDCHIVEVATVDLVLDTQTGSWHRGREWSSLINPLTPIPPEASAIHHITDDMVLDAPIIDAVTDQIFLIDQESKTKPDFFAAHEAKFDTAVLHTDNTWICSRKCSVCFWPDAPNHRNQTLRYYLGLKLADPQAAIPHRAAGDAYVTAAVIRRMLATTLVDGTKVTPELLSQISRSPVLLPKLYFGKYAMLPCTEIPIDYWHWVIKNIKDDEDVIHTATTYIAADRHRTRSRSPV